MLERQAEHDRLLSGELHLEKGPEDLIDSNLEHELRTPEVRQDDRPTAPALRLSEISRPSNIVRARRSLFARFLYAFVPQLVRTKCFNDPHSPEISHSTSWINGLRGIAAMMVFSRHYFSPFTLTTYVGYGATSNEVWIHQLPVFETFYDGLLGVVIFFTISGYVCSVKPLRAMLAGDTIHRSIAIAAFGRWFRLYLPVICSIFFIFALFRMGAMDLARPLLEDVSKYPGRAPLGSVPQYPEDVRHISHWFAAVSEISNPWTIKPEPLLVYLWTIVEEFRSSMCLYMTWFVLCVCRPWTRLPVLLLLGALYAGPWQHWPPLAFFAGAALAHFDVSRTQRVEARQNQVAGDHDLDRVNDDDANVSPSKHRHDEPASSCASLWLRLRYLSLCIRQRLRRPYRPYVRASSRLVLYFIGLYLMSYPRQELKQPSPLYRSVVNPLIPRSYTATTGPAFPKQIGVFVFMYLLSSVPAKSRQDSLWHRGLTSGICQYLGRISFAIYILQNAVYWVLGYALPHLVWRQWQPSSGSWEYAVPEDFLGGLLVGWLVSFVIVMWVADVWTREVEGRCIRFTKWLQVNVCIGK